MVHDLNDRDLWSRQGEEYLRKSGASLPSFVDSLA